MAENADDARERELDDYLKELLGDYNDDFDPIDFSPAADFHEERGDID